MSEEIKPNAVEAEGEENVEVAQEKPLEEKAEEIKVEGKLEEESKVEEPKAEEEVKPAEEEAPKDEEKLEGEPKAEEPAEDKPESSEEKVDAEELRKDLSVVKQVREELAKAYNEAKENTATIEKLSTELDTANKTLESLQVELSVYKTKEADAEKLAYDNRLNILSANFKELGQVKTVEQLSNLSKDMVIELEAVTNLAIKHKSAEKLDTKTVPSEAIKVVEPVVEKVEKAEEKLSNKDFMSGICNVLTNQQDVSGTSSKRILIL